MKTLDNLFMHFLQDVYYAERQLVKALPKMSKNAEDPALQQAFTAHCAETKVHVERLTEVFAKLGKPAKAVMCEAIKGLLAEGDEVVDDFPAGPVRDAGLLACAQAVEHYEMARYGALIAWATAAGHTEVVALLQATLDEEKHADKLLGGLAAKTVNQKAAAGLAKAA